MAGERNSSIELFRILATFSVLIVHFNGWFVGGLPQEFDFANISTFRVGQLSINSLCAVCVNCFLLISGFFGIRTTFKSVYKYIILLIGMYIPMYLLDVTINGGFSITTLISNSLPISRGGYFVQCYFMLMLLTPMLNCFIENITRRNLLCIVLLFVGIEFYFDGLRNIEWFGVKKGYSVIHFCVIYLVGVTIKAYKLELTSINRYKWVIGYVLCSIAMALMYLFKIQFAFDYSNPVVILSSVCCFVPFLYSYFVNRTINWVAKSTFAVYVLQVTDPLYSALVKTDNLVLSSNHHYSIYLLYSTFIVIVTFCICILYDKLRGAVTALFSDKLYNMLEKCVVKVRQTICR